MGESQVPLGCETPGPGSPAYSSLDVASSVLCKAGVARGLTADIILLNVLCVELGAVFRHKPGLQKILATATFIPGIIFYAKGSLSRVPLHPQRAGGKIKER